MRLLLPLAGLRFGSAMAARIEDLGTNRNHRVLTIVTKGAKKPRVPLPPILAGAIDAMLEERGHPESGPLFALPWGKSLYEL
ncbi:hypothetical protein [Actinoplanes sp. N902-109]|uniref:hypothetical protein n=1 Tax=Actinoplanes sp. (strain N902-109) TaxID=649831 RepID=UPI0003296286|nr:hypothetical protein [Actinoplanes sp. N902-109]AGL16109.1 hypothetical protein L083_2599 [Actinoplanes sp. N902-109]